MCESSFCYTEECEKLKHMDYDLLGNRILEALTEEDNSVREIGKSVISCFEDSISEVEFDAKNQILIAIRCRSSLFKLGRYRFLFLFFLVPFRPSADTQACLPLPAPSQGESKDTSVRMDFFFLSDWASPNQKEKLIRPLISMDNRIF